jgi:CTP synthase
MRLGSAPCKLRPGSLVARCYGAGLIHERHRHRYEFNNAYRARLEAAGLVASGINPELDLVECIVVPDHPFFVGVQYHPEFKSRPLEPHPLFRELVASALRHRTEHPSEARVDAREARVIELERA